MINVSNVGSGKVYLIAGGGKCYASTAAKFCRSEKGAAEIIGSDDDLKLLRNIIDSGHKAALEFDDFLFGIEGYSRVTEVQLVRKRHASYMIKSGRVDKGGKRSFDMVIPGVLEDLSVRVNGNAKFIYINDGSGDHCLSDILNDYFGGGQYDLTYDVDAYSIMGDIDEWYSQGVREGYKEEDLRYMKPQATEFKACIKMNAAALRDWFMIRMCNRAQAEIRDLATKIYNECMKVQPEMFKDAGPSCRCLGYCPELEQCAQFKGKIPTKKEALRLIKDNYNKPKYEPVHAETFPKKKKVFLKFLRSK